MNAAILFARGEVLRVFAPRHYLVETVDVQRLPGKSESDAGGAQGADYEVPELDEVEQQMLQMAKAKGIEWRPDPNLSLAKRLAALEAALDEVKRREASG